MNTDRENVTAITQALVDQGKLIEAGWQSFRIATINPAARQVQLDEMRAAFFAGAQHLLSSIMCFLEPDAEPTDKDLARMSGIADELDEFVKQLLSRHGYGPDPNPIDVEPRND